MQQELSGIYGLHQLWSTVDFSRRNSYKPLRPMSNRPGPIFSNKEVIQPFVSRQSPKPLVPPPKMIRIVSTKNSSTTRVEIQSTKQPWKQFGRPLSFLATSTSKKLACHRLNTNAKLWREAVLNGQKTNFLAEVGRYVTVALSAQNIFEDSASFSCGCSSIVGVQCSLVVPTMTSILIRGLPWPVPFI